MATIILSIPDTLAAEWTARTGLPVKECVKEAITLYNWAVMETSQGRVILSADKDGSNLARLSMQHLNQARPASRQFRNLLERGPAN